MRTTLVEEIAEKARELSESQQKEVLEFIQSLPERPPRGEPGNALLSFAGLFSPEECDQIAGAIEEGCESINPHGW